MPKRWTSKTPRCKRSGTGEIGFGCPTHEAGREPRSVDERLECLLCRAPRFQGYGGVSVQAANLIERYRAQRDLLKKLVSHLSGCGNRELHRDTVAHIRRILADEEGGE